MSDLTKEWVKFYRERGYNPLPSSCEAKKPLCTYAEYWEHQTPSDLFDRFPTTNIQIMTGARWRLLVVDIDDAQGDILSRWHRMSRCDSLPSTWITCSGGNGLHIWYSTPTNLSLPISKCVIHQGTGKHQAIEILFNRKLLMVPPSIHPVTKRPYRFLTGHGPEEIDWPTPLPNWLRHKLEHEVIRHCASLGTPRAIYEGVVQLARSWGVRFTGKHRNDWWECHAIDREDVKPSAAMHQKAGVYVDSGNGTKMGLAALAIRLGIYRTYQEALDALARRAIQ